MNNSVIGIVVAVATALVAHAAPHEAAAQWIEQLGGEAIRDASGAIVEVSLARTWATDNDFARVVEIDTLKRLDLSSTYITDRGMERIPRLGHLEELVLDTCEFITDASLNILRANKTLRKLVLRGTDITDISLPYIAELTGLTSLDLSHTMLGDGGLESLPALTQLEELNLGATRITGINLSFLKLLPKLKKLSFKGIQRRNGGACWTVTLVDSDLDAISLLPNLEELNLGAGLGLGRSGSASEGPNGSNCFATGGVTITDFGLAKLAKLKKLRLLEISGARITPSGLNVLHSFPNLERLSLWNCTAVDDSAAPILAAIPSLANLDLSDTSIGDETLRHLAALPRLQTLYLTDTKATASGVKNFREAKPRSFVSFARLPEPKRSTPSPAKPKAGADR